MGPVTIGSGGGGLPLVSMTAKAWSGWNMVFNAFKPVGRESLRLDIVMRGSYRRGTDNAFFEAPCRDRDKARDESSRANQA